MTREPRLRGGEMKIIVDAMGGDNAPKEIVLGALDALKEKKSLHVVLVGDSDHFEIWDASRWDEFCEDADLDSLFTE